LLAATIQLAQIGPVVDGRHGVGLLIGVEMRRIVASSKGLADPLHGERQALRSNSLCSGLAGLPVDVEDFVRFGR